MLARRPVKLLPADVPRSVTDLRGHAVRTRRTRISPDTPQRPAQILRREHQLPQRDLQAGDDSILRARRPAATLSCGAQRTSPSPPATGPHPRDGCDHRDQHEQHRFLRLTRRSVLPGPSLIPAGTTTSADFCPVSPHLAMRAVGAATRQHNRHPDRPPRIRTINFPLRPPRLRDDPVGDDGLYLLEQAHPDRPASHAVRVPRCRVSPRASFPPRLTTTQLPPARS